jgi:uncharacterized protein
MNQKFHLITLGVKDFSRSLEFYEKGLGWKKSSASMNDIAFFPLGGIVLALYPRDLLAQDIGISSAGTGFSGVTISYNAHSEQEVLDILAMAEAIGARIIKPGQKVFWGGFSGYFSDPEGNIIEVAHNPFWEFDANDNLILPQ